MSAPRFLREYKLAIIGDGVGKTALTIRFEWGQFVEDYDLTIEEAHRKQVVVDDEAALIDIFDAAREEVWIPMRDKYVRAGEGFLLVYSITSWESFEETNRFHQQILQVKDKDNVPILLIGNKHDLDYERQVGMDEGRDLAMRLGCAGSMETSAKHSTNVDEAFYSLVREIRKHERKDTSTASQHPDKPQSAGCRGGCVIL